MTPQELGDIDALWSGWTLADGDLVAPEGVHYTPAQIRAVQYTKERLRELEHLHSGPIQFLLRV